MTLNDDELSEELRRALGMGQTARLRELLAARTAGKYDILEEIGQGSGSTVFKAMDLRSKRTVAIKCLKGKPGDGGRVSLHDEALAASRVRHPHLGEILAYFDDAELPFMILEYVEGKNLTAWAEGRTVADRLRIFRQILSGVEALHRQGLVHRDLKPGNILVAPGDRVKILDLGIARETGLSLIYQRDIQGTPAYVAPEQSYGANPLPSMDVFALGVLLFELLTGQRPFSGNRSRNVLSAIRNDPPPLPRSLAPSIPGPLQAICLTALEKEPDRRYPTAREFRLDLDRFLQGEAVAADPTLLDDILEHGVSRHLADLKRWQDDRLVTAREHDYFASKYDRLQQREAFWVLDSRRISFSQVLLYLGVWACIVSAMLMLFFTWKSLGRTARISLPLGILSLLSIAGYLTWAFRIHRIGLVLLVGSALTLPLFIATTMVAMEWLPPTPGETSRDLIQGYMSNFQLLIAAAAFTGISLVFWKKTRTTAFSLVTGGSILALATAVFAFFDLRQLVVTDEWDLVAREFFIPGAVLFLTGLLIDLKGRLPALAAPLYILGVAVLVITMTVAAAHGSTLKWLGLKGELLPQEDQVAYSFMLNGVLFLLSGLLADRSRHSRWLRRIAVLLFWLTPTHVLAPIAYFALEEKWVWSVLPQTWNLSELVLPLGSLFFVFASVPKQMKSFFLSGLFYIAVSVVWLTHHHFIDRFAWPLCLAAGGLLLLVAAWRRPALFEKDRGKTS